MSYIKQKDEGVPADNIEGTIAPNQVAFGDPVNSGKIEGSNNFTFVDESGGTGPTTAIKGDRPTLALIDDTAATDYQTELQQSGSSLYFLSKDTAGTNNQVLRVAPGTLIVNEGGVDIDFRVEGVSSQSLLRTNAAQENVGVGLNPSSAVQRLHVEGDSADTSTTDPVVLIENEASGREFTALELKNKSDDADSDVIFRMTSLAATDSDFEIKHDSFGGTTFVTGQPDTVTRRNLVMSNTIFNVNADQADIDTQIESTGVAAMFHVDAGNDVVGIGTVADSAYERLHVKGTGLTDMVVFEGTSEGSGSTDGPDLILYNSATPTGPNKFIGRLEFRGKDDAGTAVSYGSIQSFIQDETAGTTDGLLLLKTQTGSSQLEKIRLDQNGVKINETGNSGVNMRVKTSNSTVQQDFFRTYNSATVQSRYTEVLRGTKILTTTPVTVTTDRMYGSNIAMDTGSSSVVLPEAVPGMHFQLVNKNISGVSVTPATGDTINGSSSAYSISHNWTIYKFICITDGEWVAGEARG